MNICLPCRPAIRPSPIHAAFIDYRSLAAELIAATLQNVQYMQYMQHMQQMAAAITLATTGTTIIQY